MPDGHNNVDSTILKLAEEYQATVVKSRELNERRAEIRSNVEKIGIDPVAFQAGLRMARDMTTGERSDYTGSLNRVLGVLDGKEADLFGADDIAKRDKRAAKRAERELKKGTAREAQDDKSDANPKSDPKRGGAGRGKKTEETSTETAPPTTLAQASKQSDAAVAESLKEVQAREQQEGGAVLDTVGTASVDKVVDGGGETGAPISQSQKAADKLAAAKLN